LKFSRPSHLHRHQLTHTTSNSRQHIPCPYCQKTFSRRDVLLRHLRHGHQIQEQTRRSSQKSCFRCVERKAKCNRERPCNGCIRSGNNCEYPPTDGLDDWESHGGATPTEQPILPPNTHQIRDQADESMTSQSNEETPSFQHERRSDSLSLGDLTDPVPLPPTSVVHQVHHVTDQACPVGPFYNLDDESTISPTMDIPQSFNVLPVDAAHSVFEDTFALSPSSMLPGQPNFRTGGFDWLNFDIGNSPQSFQLDTFYNSYIPEFWSSSTTQQVPESGGPSSSDVDNGAHDTLGSEESRGGSQAVGLPDTEQHTLAWPFDQAHKQTPYRYQLPPLRDILNGYCPTNRPKPVQTTLVKGFIQILSDNPLPQLESLRDPHSIQAFCSLQRLVDSYFSRFHDVQAIIHKPTWTMSACPPILLTAMASVGALLSDSQSDYGLSVALSEICSTMINWMVGLHYSRTIHHTDSPRVPQMLQTIAISHISMHSASTKSIP
jgi:hypothetical protein